MTNGKINRSVKLAGMGNALGGSQLVFGGEKRYRLRPGESLLDLACLAAERALEEAGEEIGGVDCIVCAMATPLQAIPCNAALVHERMARAGRPGHGHQYHLHQLHQRIGCHVLHDGRRTV